MQSHFNKFKTKAMKKVWKQQKKQPLQDLMLFHMTDLNI